MIGTSAQIAVWLQRQMELNLPDGFLQVAEAPFEEWAAQQGSISSQKVIAQVGVIPEVVGIMQYLMARVADQQKRTDEAAALYEASFIHGMYVAALDYSKMLDAAAESNPNLSQSANDWLQVANDCHVLGTAFQKMMLGLNDGMTTKEQLVALLSESIRRGESLGAAFLSSLNVEGVPSDAIRESIGLTDEALKKMEEPSGVLVLRLASKIPGGLDRDGIDKHKAGIAALAARAMDQDT